MPSCDGRCVSIRIIALVNHPNLVHTQLECRPDRRQAINLNLRRRIHVDDLGLTTFLQRQTRLVVVLSAFQLFSTSCFFILRTSYQLYNPPPDSDGERFKDDGDRSGAIPNTIISEEE